MEGWTDRVVQERREMRLRQQAAATAIARGEISVPLRCDHCKSPSWTADDAVLVCLQCSRVTPFWLAHETRKDEIRMIVAAGIDPRPSRRGS